ncbi:hypothetical protein HN419_06280 [Candidatus Woesearchaeota archaeon]|jgi:helicase|nr:hypothetical protein [Candidatus Woesearchaeota archaeon]MBT3538102.1 hypothetical protein [Candidatus Woesearchaeota archaeon]MBT4697539.1 hypothetical protein [Candidatus Woesearchaeota archaeon]MBT4717386.1 hypothetical protein [Candidatus Woesearchaeota archaeon]MBT7105771.1 hypothetical protein [Candidatus Woesearchaeota archaeon]
MSKTVHIPLKTNNQSINIALDTIQIGKQALIFVNTKRSAEKLSEDISKKIKHISLPTLSASILKAVSSPTKQCRRLSKIVEKGVAFHHAGLVSKQRELIEDKFREGVIKVICCTPTLAFGLDMPAFRAVIRDLKRFSVGTSWGMTDIPVLEYMQMAGRAGRPGKEDYGEAICIAQTESDKDFIEQKYIEGEPECIYSKLAVEPVLRTYLLSLIASHFVRTYDDIITFFSKTFWAYQFEDMNRLESIINKMLKLLVDFEFIEMSETTDDFVSAQEMAERKVKATKLGERVAQLYIDPLTANKLIEDMKASAEQDLTAFSVLHMVCSTLELRPYLRIKAKEVDKIEERYAEFADEILADEPEMFEDHYSDFMDSIKTSLFMYDWIEEKGEEYLLETFDIRPGEIKAKLDRADWLLYACVELSKIIGLTKVNKDITKTRMRLKSGVKEELLSLLRLKGVGRIRARKMFNNGIKDLKDAKTCDLTKLAQLIGRAISYKIKEQLGQKVTPIKENKRKGQINLNDFR